jgi:DNA-binding NarL/FixJ family response regulator
MLSARSDMRSWAHQVLPAAETEHEVVLMKLDLPSDIDTAPLVGLALTEALLERDPNERVLLYADIEGQEYVDRARRVGAAGCLSKREIWLPELQEAIETVAAGGEFWPECPATPPWPSTFAEP